MLNWKETLPAEQEHMGYPLRRTPTSAPLQATITSDKLLVMDTHWAGTRTIPCTREEVSPDGTTKEGYCPACEVKTPFRTHVYVTAIDSNSKEHFIFECTANAAKAFQKYFKGNGTLRGCVFYAIRPKQHRSGQVVIETNTADLSKVHLPKAPNLRLALSVIWRIPMTNEQRRLTLADSGRVVIPKAVQDRTEGRSNNEPQPVPFAEVVAAIQAEIPSGDGK